jgi:hypothetical protein
MKVTDRYNSSELCNEPLNVWHYVNVCEEGNPTRSEVLSLTAIYNCSFMGMMLTDLYI